MKETTFSNLFMSLWIGLGIAFVIAMSIMTIWKLSKPNYTRTNSIEVASDEIKAAMNKMGPMYNYMMIDEILYVDKGDGKWLKLRYERKEWNK